MSLSIHMEIEKPRTERGTHFWITKDYDLYQFVPGDEAEGEWVLQDLEKEAICE